MSVTATLVLGGARSGKSVFAEKLVEASEGEKIYLATGQGLDAEMRQRIDIHQNRRGAQWTTIEAPIDICKTLKNISHNHVVLLDCITMWVSNLMAQERDIAAETERFCELIAKAEYEIVIVSNEVGLGIVPDNKLARLFRDEAGLANQLIAQACQKVVFVTAGLPLTLKG